MIERHDFLKVAGNRIENARGETVVLKGIGMPGWMLMENWINGFPAHEQGMRESVKRVIGRERYDLFFDRFLDYFFSEEDAKFIASLGLNLLRIPLHYRQFEDDHAPFRYHERAFQRLDRVIEICGKYGIYTIPCLHALPGFQNQDWHSDNPTHQAFFWQHPHFHERAVRLWEELARRYRGNPSVAGFNPINEPADPSETQVVEVSRRIFDAIRAVDPDHMIFLEGNRYSLDFHIYSDELWPNTVYTVHDYAPPGFMPGSKYPGTTAMTHMVKLTGRRSWSDPMPGAREIKEEFYDRDAIEQLFLSRTEFMRRNQTPIWIGEFNVILSSVDSDTIAMRHQLLRDQFDIYRKHGVHWAFWPYKDIGLVAPVFVDPDSPWMRRIRPMLERKAKLGVDLWGGQHDNIQDVMAPLSALFAREFPGYEPFPFGVEFKMRRLVPQLLLAEALLPEFGELFRDITESEIDELMQSFRFDRCRQRGPLVKMLREATSPST